MTATDLQSRDPTISDSQGTALGRNWLEGSLGRTTAIVGSLSAYFTAVVVFFQQFRAVADQIPLFGFIALLSAPVLVFVLLSVLPEMIARKRKRQILTAEGGGATGNELARRDFFRITPYDEVDRETFMRFDNADHDLISWFEKSKVRVLHFSGPSGVGKTSLLNGFFFNKVRDLGYDVLSLRVFDMPSIESMIQASAGSNRLIIVVDQFEEYLKLSSVNAYKDALGRILNSEALSGLPIHRVILVWRSDYQAQIFADDVIPAPGNDRNWFQLNAYNEVAAAKFLKQGKPDLTQDQLEAILAGLNKIEGITNNYRLITLNMVGKILNEYAFRIEADLRDLIQLYLRRSISLSPIVDTLRSVLGQMISTSGSRIQVLADSLVSSTRLSKPEIMASLAELETKGIVRRIDRADNVWEVSHDFIAHILAQIILAIRPSLLRRARIAGGPLVLIAAAITVVFGVPAFAEYRRSETASILFKLGVELEEGDRLAVIGEEREEVNLALLSSVPSVEAIHFKRVPSSSDLDLISHFPQADRIAITDSLVEFEEALDDEALDSDLMSTAPVNLKEDSMGGLLDFIKSPRVQSALLQLDVEFEGGGSFDLYQLDKLKKLRQLSLGNIKAVNQTSYSVIELPNLKKFSITNSDIENLFFLRSARNLRSLAIKEVPNIKSFAFLPLECGLTVFRVTEAYQLDDASDAGKCTSLEVLAINDATQLQSIEFVGDLNDLKTLDLRWGQFITDISPIQKLKALQSLTLDGVLATASATKVTFPKGLTSLSLRFAPSTFRVEVLSDLKLLEFIDLYGSDSVIDIAALNGLSNLTAVNVGATGISGKVDLSNLTKLQQLDVSELLHPIRLFGLTTATDMTPIKIEGSKEVLGIPQDKETEGRLRGGLLSLGEREGVM